jgi:hypothetical protein
MSLLPYKVLITFANITFHHCDGVAANIEVSGANLVWVTGYPDWDIS